MSNTFNAVYQYAVVRFMPFIETRESVLHLGNIGRMMGDIDLVELDKLYQRFVARDFVNDDSFSFSS